MSLSLLIHGRAVAGAQGSALALLVAARSPPHLEVPQPHLLFAALPTNSNLVCRLIHCGCAKPYKLPEEMSFAGWASALTC